MALEAWDKLVRGINALTTPADTQPVDLRRGQEILFMPINITNSGDNVIVGGGTDPTSKIKVLGYTLISEGTVSVQWRSTSGLLTGAMPLIANTGVTAGGGNAPGSMWLFETLAAGEDLMLRLSAICGVRGHMTYFAEP